MSKEQGTVTKGSNKKPAASVIYWVWRMLQLIPRYPDTTTASKLHKRLQLEGIVVDLKTVQRNLKAISEMQGFPIVRDPEDGGKHSSRAIQWSWAQDAPEVNIAGMNPPTALTYKLAKEFLSRYMPQSLLKNIEPYFERAETVLEHFVDKKVRTYPEKIRVIQRGPKQKPAKVDLDIWNIVCEAILLGKRFEMGYLKRGENEIQTREFTPLGIVFREPMVYIVGVFGDFEEPRQLALNRIQSAMLSDKTRKIVKDFDLDQYIKAGNFDYIESGKERSLKIKLLMDTQTVQNLEENPLGDDQVITEVEGNDKKRIVTVTMLNSSQFRWWVLGYGETIEVLEPQELRDEFRERAQKMLDLYQ
ncbi:MAG: putative DNA-binding transcriptional regulator YafY [bacterium]|jgi:predicted DNA-binding transcriptional regulator YafY